MSPIVEIGIIGVGGAAGAMCRYGIQQAPLFGADRFWLTCVVNLVGCFLIGVAASAFATLSAPQWVNRLLIGGFLGGFTTYSTFALDGVTLISEGRIGAAAAYLIITLVAGLFLCRVGYILADNILR